MGEYLMEPINVLIVEDEYLVAELMKQSFNNYEDINPVGIAKNGVLALEFLENNNNVDVVLLDINMPEMNGIDTLLAIKKRKYNVRTIMLSCHVETSLIDKALSFGAFGYISKTISSEEVYNSIKTVSLGGHYMCSETIKALSRKGKRKEDSGIIFGKKLSEREMEVLHYITLGFSNQEISTKMCISIRTVESHRRNILRKFGEKNFIGLIRTLMEQNLVDLSKFVKIDYNRDDDDE